MRRKLRLASEQTCGVSGETQKRLKDKPYPPLEEAFYVEPRIIDVDFRDDGQPVAFERSGCRQRQED
jgi:hypothetical protein